MRAVFGDLLRSRRAYLGRPAGDTGGRWRPFRRDLEFGVHAVRAAHRRQARRPAAAVDRHRHGARAHRRGAARHPRQLQDRSVRRADRGRCRSHRRRPRWRAKSLAPRHRRPFARVGVLDCGRRAAVERRPRLCAPPHHAPRHAPRPVAWRQRPVDVAPRAGAGARDGAGLSRAASHRRDDRRDAEA